MQNHEVTCQFEMLHPLAQHFSLRSDSGRKIPATNHQQPRYEYQDTYTNASWLQATDTPAFK